MQASVDNECIHLCSHRYMIVYKCNKVLLVDSVVCSICGIKRKHEHLPSVRFRPNPHLLQPFLNETFDFDGHLHEVILSVVVALSMPTTL